MISLPATTNNTINNTNWSSKTTTNQKQAKWLLKAILTNLGALNLILQHRRAIAAPVGPLDDYAIVRDIQRKGILPTQLLIQYRVPFYTAFPGEFVGGVW